MKYSIYHVSCNHVNEVIVDNTVEDQPMAVIYRSYFLTIQIMISLNILKLL